MTALLRFCLTALVGAASLSVRAADLAVPFRKMTFDEARQAAAADGKLVFIDFYTTWCEPCKRLDADTFSHAGVGALVGDHAIPIKLDAEKEGKDVAQRYKISAYPTLLVVKSDGTEVDRIIGFREPAQFTTDFKQIVVTAKAGKTGLDRAREQVAQVVKPDAVTGDAEEAQPHFDLAKKLIASGKNEEALKELVWCWDEGKKDPEFSRMRSSLVGRELGRLARDYPPAREVIVARRNQARDRALANKGGSVVVQDLIQLNKELKEEEDTLAVFDQMPAGDRRRTTISIYLFDLLLEKKRYADALLFNMPETYTSEVERAKAQAKKGGDQGAMSLRYTVARLAKRVEALAGNGQPDDARKLGELLLTLDASDDTKSLLRQHATRAGQPELFATLASPVAKP